MVVNLAVEVGREARRQARRHDVRRRRHPQVLNHSKPAGFDPVRAITARSGTSSRHGFARTTEIAQMDGAIIVSSDGTVEAACRYVDSPAPRLRSPRLAWHGRRGDQSGEHAVAVTVSESNERCDLPEWRISCCESSRATGGRWSGGNSTTSRPRGGLAQGQTETASPPKAVPGPAPPESLQRVGGFQDSAGRPRDSCGAGSPAMGLRTGSHSGALVGRLTSRSASPMVQQPPVGRPSCRRVIRCNCRSAL